MVATVPGMVEPTQTPDDSTPAGSDGSGSEPVFAPVPGHTDVVLAARQGSLGRVRLNRPKAINALDDPMVEAMLTLLQEWAADDSIQAVLLDGSGERGLCAGGDVVALRNAAVAGDVGPALHFWRREYELNRLIHDYPKPYAAWMDGVVMGGGIGVSVHGRHRWVTERTRAAMPETAIGFFPDVGGCYYLAHAPGETGTHAALTGVPIAGADAVALGFADLLVESGEKESIVAGFASGEMPRGLARGEVESSLMAGREWIDECYAGDDPVAIVQRLAAHDHPDAKAAAEVIRGRSPFSVAVTLEALRRSQNLDVSGVLAQDETLTRTFAAHPDFAEGVRALLVDKDKNPHWAHPDLESVPRAEVEAAFEG